MQLENGGEIAAEQWKWKLYKWKKDAQQIHWGKKEKVVVRCGAKENQWNYSETNSKKEHEFYNI